MRRMFIYTYSLCIAMQFPCAWNYPYRYAFCAILKVSDYLKIHFNAKRSCNQP